MVTPWHSPSTSACSMTVAVWNPPVQSTGMLDRLLDAVRVGQVHPLDVPEVAAGLFPSPLEEPAGEAAVEEEVVAPGQQSARDERVVGLAQLLDGQVACGIARVREEAAARHVDGVDALRFEQPADLDGVFERVPFRLVVEERVVVLDRADLHLQVEVAADLRRESRGRSRARSARGSSARRRSRRCGR